MKEKEVRCVLCGKIIEGGDQTIRLTEGEVVNSRFRTKKQWGLAHLDCFNRAMPSPKAALAEIRRLAKLHDQNTE